MGKEGRKFDTKIQYLKYKVLREVARIAYNSDSGFELANSFNDIAKVIVPGPKATMRCCIYKERAIIAERIKMACGGNKNNPNVIEVIDIACDECPASGYQVSHDCRGCIAHRCQKGSDNLRPQPESTYRQNQVRQLRRLRKSVPLFRHFQL